MALTEFGKAVRKARIDVGESIASMADSLKVSAAFLSGVETGRKKIPASLVQSVDDFFRARNKIISNLPELAAVSNKSVSLEGLSPTHQMLVAGFARAEIDQETLENMARLLSAANSSKDIK